MPNTLFTNVQILDGTGAEPYAGEVLVQGNRIKQIGKDGNGLPHGETASVSTQPGPEADIEALSIRWL